MTGILVAAAAAGFMGSPHCVGMCGAFATACARSVPDAGAWSAGRLTGYAILGAAAGAVGDVIPGPTWIPFALSLALVVWFAGSLAGFLPEPKLGLERLSKSSARMLESRGPLATYGFGVANGFLPCGLVYTALGIPVATQDPLMGALAMVAFGAGTVPVIAAFTLGLRHLVARSLRLRRLLAAAVLISALWSIGFRASMDMGVGGHGGTPGMQQPAQ